MAVLAIAGWSAMIGAVGCGGSHTKPTGPCMSDAACRADRICHKGACRFEEEVRAEIDQGANDPTSGGFNTDPDAGHGFMGSSQHTGRSANKGPETEPEKQWAYQTGARVFASPIIGQDGHIYIGSLDGQFVALSANGKLLWRHTAAGKIYTTALLVRDTVIFGTSEGELIALSTDGRVRWSHRLSDAIDASPALGPNNTLYVAADGLYAFDLEGNPLWQVPTLDHIRTSPTVHPSGLVVIGTAEGNVLGIRDGAVAWQARVDGSVEGSASITPSGTIVVGTVLGNLVALSSVGRELWRFKVGDELRATPAVTKTGDIIVGSYDQHVYALTGDGQLRWKVPTSGRIRSSARIDDNQTIYLGSQDNFLYAISVDGDVIWRHNVGQDVDSSVDIARDGTLYLGADDGRVHALR